MKSFFIAKNYQWLFIKCIIAEILVNLFFCFIYNFKHSYDPFILDFILGIIQICISIGLGIYIRNKNKNLFLIPNNSKKFYVTIISLADLFGVLFILLPDIFAMIYIDISTFFYNILRLERIFSFWDLFSYLLCLSIIFLFHKVDCKIK